MATLTSGSAPGSAVTSPFRAPVRLPRSNSRKSPPLAFEKTPNDALAPLISPPEQELDAMSPGDSYTVIEKQANALAALHAAFNAEREAWNAERTTLYQRVANLERLLRAQSGHSPAKSPIISPNGTITSPQARATSNLRLPSITEDENLRPLSDRREHAPRAISIPTIATIEEGTSHHSRGSVDFSYNAASQLDELGVTPPRSAKCFEAPDIVETHGKTNHSNKIRPPTPPPKDMTLTGVEDTPTRNNTHINALLTQSDGEDDVGLKGPLNLPELPSKPTLHNFTEEMLVKRLEQIAQHPAENKPTIFSVPSPGLAIAEEDGIDAGLSPKTGITTSSEGVLAPVATREQTVRSPEADATSDPDQEEKFAQGGIRLKKKPSTNFGVPFGQLGGFGNLRKLS